MKDFRLLEEFLDELKELIFFFNLSFHQTFIIFSRVQRNYLNLMHYRRQKGFFFFLFNLVHIFCINTSSFYNN